MFNLLPKTEKEIIRREYRTRLAVVCLWFSFAVFAFSSLLLLPALFLSSEKEKTAQEHFETLSKSVGRSNAAELDATLKDAKSRLALFSRASPKMFLHEMLALIVSIKTDRISLTRFAFVAPAEGKREVDIVGVGKNRSALTAFIKALERTRLFEKVEVPISNFAKDTDIDFSARASGEF